MCMEVRNVTKSKKLTAQQKRTVAECERIMADSATTWQSWDEVRKQLGI